MNNKLSAIAIIFLGALSVPIEWDATFFIFALIIGVALFFSKENQNAKEADMETGSNDLRRNASGYFDSTAYEAIKSADADDERFHKLLNTIFNICELSGFHLEERIVLKDTQTGKIWR